MSDIIGIVTLERLQKSVKRFPEDTTYISMLLDRFLKQQMRKLAAEKNGGKDSAVNIGDIRKALALFGVKLISSGSLLQGENAATIDYRACTVSWYTYIKEKDKSEPIGRKWIIHSPGGVSTKIEKLKKNRRSSSRKRFSDLSPELQEKIRKRNPKIFS